MLLTTITWVIVANAERCRVLEERRRGGPLTELEAWACEPTEQDRARAHPPTALRGPRFALSRSRVDLRDLEAQGERRFVTRFAHRLSLAGVKGRFERLILIATPPAMGVLREELDPPIRRRVERTSVCDCVGDAPEALRERVRALRAPR